MEKMNFKNLDFYECPICGKKLFMYYSSVGPTGYGFNFFDCDSTTCKRYAAIYRIVKNQRKAVKYYDFDNGDNVYEKQYKMAGVNNESK